MTPKEIYYIEKNQISYHVYMVWHSSTTIVSTLNPLSIFRKTLLPTNASDDAIR